MTADLPLTTPLRPGRRRRTGTRLTSATLVGLLWVAVLTQRLQVPPPVGVSLSAVALYVAIIILLATRAAQVVLTRLMMLVSILALLALTAWLSGFSQNRATITSFLLLVVLYLPWVLRIGVEYQSAFARLCRSFVRLMAVLSVVGVVQMVTQATGLWRHEDYLADLVPPTWIVPGYNTVNQIAWNNPTVKAQAFVFLEPSLLSQYCALALLLVFVHRLGVKYLVVLLAGMISTLSGTGVVLLGVGLLVLVIRRVVRVRYLVAMTVIAAVAVLTPIGAPMLDRTDELSASDTSGSFRFVQPFAQVKQGLDESPIRYLIGAGPGMSERALESGREQAGQPVVYNIPLKLTFEYGLPSAVAFVAFLLIALLWRGPAPGLSAGLVAMLFVLSGSLLQASTLTLAWLLRVIWIREPSRSDSSQPRAEDYSPALGRPGVLTDLALR